MWLRAGRQLTGRGRHGRPWASETGNLYASTLVRLQPGDPAAATLALVAAVALEEVASLWLAGARTVLKWPNDLLVGGAKLSGVLLERTEDAVVIGFGVNLREHPEAIGQPATDIAAITGAAPDPAEFLIALAEAFARWLSRWRQEGLAPVRGRWLEKAHPIGTPLSVRVEDEATDGLFDGLDADGALLLRTAGAVRRVLAGDVALL